MRGWRWLSIETLPAQTVASVRRHTGLAGIGAAAGPPRETYLNDPAVTPEAELLTQVAYPIR
ncbi:hypothetical protein [Sinosporangium siamense]|uniref:Uncharacterized protein n=1 Tax=Sinosporangium siamense TaxID=1367973 RepID=A0A919RKQ1_9ACTN|nr:hypothetical protein [Sinosporangium siamense]GII95616.1 hypothetical protein Ssi02_58470 [Sinosporangium siamense]